MHNNAKPPEVRVVLQHEAEEDRLEDVKLQMQQRGSPSVVVFRLMDDRFMAVEGVHRLTAAHQLNVPPNLLVLGSHDLDTLWADVVGESFDGEREMSDTRVRDIMQSLERHVASEGSALPVLCFTEFKITA